jgi:hypothetical protein
MSELPVTKKVETRVRAKGKGGVFSTSEFLDLGSRAAVDQALSRLARRGLIRRISRGIYDYPRTNRKLGVTLSPSPDAVVHAIARRGGNRIQLAGAEAAKALGLTTQVPTRVVYLTDGAGRNLHVGGQVIELRHSPGRSVAAAGKVSGTVIQALQHLGRRLVDEHTVRHLQQVLSRQDKDRLRKDRVFAPGWMQPVLLEIVSAE